MFLVNNFIRGSKNKRKQPNKHFENTTYYILENTVCLVLHFITYLTTGTPSPITIPLTWRKHFGKHCCRWWDIGYWIWDTGFPPTSQSSYSKLSSEHTLLIITTKDIPTWFLPSFFFKFIYFERERERERERVYVCMCAVAKGQTERGRDRESQAGSTPPVQSLMQGLNSWTARSWPEPMLNP